MTVHQALVALRLFQRTEILALHILDDSDLERFAVIELADLCRDLMQLRALGRPPAAFAGDDLEGTVPVRVPAG